MRLGALVLTALLLGGTALPAQQASSSKKTPAKKSAATAASAKPIAPTPVAATASQDSQPAQLSTTADSVPDSTAQKPRGKGGLLGKAKKLAKNKVVQTVAKTAACTMVPGGQAIAGAIDAAAAKNAGEAAQGAASAATGSSCMPGMGGAGMAGTGLAGAGMPGEGMAGMAGAGMAGAASAVGGGPLSAMAGGGMPAGGSMSTAQMQQMQLMQQMQVPGGSAEDMGYGGMMVPDEVGYAQCLGISIDEYRSYTNPTGGEARPVTKSEMKQQMKIAKKVQGRQQACAMQQAQKAMAMSQQAVAPQQAMAQEQVAAANAEITTEAPGKQPSSGPDLAAELKKGKTSVHDIDWVAGGVTVSDAGKPGFDAVMARLAAAMHQAGGSYRIDIYLDKRYGDAEVKTLSPSRIATVVLAIQSASSGSPVSIKAGSGKKDKDPRLEIVRTGH
jgi:hypothetical protein